MSQQMRADAEAFYSYLLSERRASPLTLRSYRQVLERCLTILEREFPELDSFAGLQKQHMRLLSREFNFTEDMQELSSASVAHHLYALSSFFKFLVQKGRLQHNPARLVRAPRVHRRLPQVLTLREVLTILEEIIPRNPYQVRDLCIMELLFASGLRVAELVGLNCGDIDFSQRELRVLGKGSKERVVPVGSLALKSLRNYLETVRDQLKPQDEALFISCRGRRITTRAVEQNLHRLAQSVGLGGRVTPHKFRHAFATELLAHGADLRTVQELLGHASLAATQIYTHVNLEQLHRTYDKAHPRALRPSPASPGSG